jgi:hypothetical protein
VTDTSLPLPRLWWYHHNVERDGIGCVEDMIAWLNGDGNTDKPSCTHPLLATTVAYLNDTICMHDPVDGLPNDTAPLCASCSDRVWRVALRAVGTAVDQKERDDMILYVRLAIWAARSVQHLVHPQDHDICEQAIATAETWVATDEPPGLHLGHAAAHVAEQAARNYDVFANPGGLVAAKAAAVAALSTFSAERACCGLNVDTYNNASNALRTAASIVGIVGSNDPDATAREQWVHDLIDEFYRLTGLTETLCSFPEERWAALHALLAKPAASS